MSGHTEESRKILSQLGGLALQEKKRKTDLKGYTPSKLSDHKNLSLSLNDRFLWSYKGKEFLCTFGCFLFKEIDAELLRARGTKTKPKSADLLRGSELRKRKSTRGWTVQKLESRVNQEKIAFLREKEKEERGKEEKKVSFWELGYQVLKNNLLNLYANKTITPSDRFLWSYKGEEFLCTFGCSLFTEIDAELSRAKINDGDSKRSKPQSGNLLRDSKLHKQKSTGGWTVKKLS